MEIGRLPKVVCCYIKQNKTFSSLYSGRDLFSSDGKLPILSSFWLTEHLNSTKNNIWLSRILCSDFVQIFDIYYTTLKYRFHCNWNFIRMYYQGIKFILKRVIVFISYLLILISLRRIHSLFYLLMDLIIHLLAVQFKQIEMRYSNTSVSDDNL